MAELRKRRDAYGEIESRFGFLYSIEDQSPSDIRQDSAKMAACYPDDLDADVFPDEMVHLASFLESMDNPSPSEMLQIIRSRDLDVVYPNAAIALRFYLCSFATNCTGERSFSALTRVKSELRARSSQERVSALSLLFIECDLVNKISFDQIIADFSEAKARKKAVI